MVVIIVCPIFMHCVVTFLNFEYYLYFNISFWEEEGRLRINTLCMTR